MESQKQIPSLSSIHIKSLIWSEESQHSLDENISPSHHQIYTVNNAITNPFILAHIKPDYGSLGEFMKDVDLSKDLLNHNKKKKTELMEDYEEKKMRNSLKDKNLDAILKSNASTPHEKSIASKMIIQNLFEKNFGMSLASFSIQNAKPQNIKTSSININTLEIMLNQIIQKPKNRVSFSSEKRESFIPESNIPQKLRSTNVKKLTYQNVKFNKFQILEEIKNKYKNNKKHYLQPTTSKMKESQRESLKSNDQNIENKIEQQKSKQKLKKQSLQLILSQGEQNSERTKLINTTKFLLKHQNNPTLDQLSSKLSEIPIESIQCFEISHSKISDDNLCFVLEVFEKLGSSLKEIICQNLHLQNPQKICLKLKDVIEVKKISKLSVNQMKLKSKDFCLICLGVGSKMSFEYLSFKQNQIDDLAKKCLDVILKFHKETVIDLSKNPIHKELKGKKMYKNVIVN